MPLGCLCDRQLAVFDAGCIGRQWMLQETGDVKFGSLFGCAQCFLQLDQTRLNVVRNFRFRLLIRPRFCKSNRSRMGLRQCCQPRLKIRSSFRMTNSGSRARIFVRALAHLGNTLPTATAPRESARRSRGWGSVLRGDLPACCEDPVDALHERRA